MIAALPDFVAEHHDRFGARPVVILAEVAAEHRLDAESGEEVRRDGRALYTLRLITIGERDDAAAAGSHGRQRRGAFANVLQVQV